MPTTATRELIIWRGSQFSTKVLAALRVKGYALEADFRVSSVANALETRQRLLPAPHTVPVLRWDGEVVAGSDHICAFLDAQSPPSAPLLYPIERAAEVRELEAACAGLYWVNGWLSVVDPDGFERWSGERARRYIAGGGAGAAAKLAQSALPRRFMRRLVHGAAKKDFLGMLRRRVAALDGDERAAIERLAAERDVGAVLATARDALGKLDAALQASATPFFCGSPTPTAADLTLYGMLERWVGDSLCPGMNGAAQPAILEGLPAVGAAWEEMRARFRPACLLHELKQYDDVTEVVGEATWPKGA